MSGETNLSHLLASMEPLMDGEVYVFSHLAQGVQGPTEQAIMTFHEAEGTTLILPRSVADAHGLVAEFPCRRITLTIHSALDAVGFLAAITTELAKLKIGVNPVSAFFHDHLFVPEDHGEAVMEALHALSDRHRLG